MASKVRVYAKSQKWAALGIVDAYLKMYPYAALEDLNKAFPRSLFLESEPDQPLLVTMEEKAKMAAATKTDFDDNQLADWKVNHYYLTMSDGNDIVFTVPMWTKEMFEKMLSQAKLYDIEIAKYEAAEKGIGKRGEYTLEYLNDYVPPVPDTISDENAQDKQDLVEFDDSAATEYEYMIIKIRQEVIDNCGSVYEAVRKAWHLDPNKAGKYKYVLASRAGEVVGIFKNMRWYPAPDSDRYMFDADEVKGDSAKDKLIRERYLHKRLPKRYMKKGASNPILYQTNRDGYVTPVPQPIVVEKVIEKEVVVEKKSKKWIWILLAALVIIAILIILLLIKGCRKEEPQVVEVEKVVVVHDTLYIRHIEAIEKEFNAAEFVKGKADLSESAKFVLHDLAKVMQKNPQVRLRLEGHTSAEGTPAFNQKLSEQRAQAAVDFMIEHEGIDASRLEAVGKGSSEPKNATDPTAPENRRTEFIVLE